MLEQGVIALNGCPMAFTVISSLRPIFYAAASYSALQSTVSLDLETASLVPGVPDALN
jgi:hypothetical protein